MGIILLMVASHGKLHQKYVASALRNNIEFFGNKKMHTKIGLSGNKEMHTNVGLSGNKEKCTQECDSVSQFTYEGAAPLARTG